MNRINQNKMEGITSGSLRFDETTHLVSREDILRFDNVQNIQITDLSPIPYFKNEGSTMLRMFKITGITEGDAGTETTVTVAAEDQQAAEKQAADYGITKIKKVNRCCY